MRFDGAELRMTGRAATNPAISGTSGDRVSFRAVSTERRFDQASASWIDGDEFGANIVCWGKTGVAVLQLVRKGDPVVIDGRLSTRKYDRNGVTEYFTDCTADHVAIDVARAIGRFRRDPSFNPDAAASKLAADPAAAPASVTSEDTGDPFQDASEPAGEQELVAAF